MVALLLAGCASQQELENPVANYYLLRNDSAVDYQVKPGLFHVQAYGQKSLFGILNDDTARKTWAARATQLCGSANYAELFVREHYVNHNGTASQPHKDAYALCANSGMSKEDAIALISPRSQAEARASASGSQ